MDLHVNHNSDLFVGESKLSHCCKALRLGDYAGFARIVVDEKYGGILGAYMLGPEVTKLLPERTLAYMMGLTPHEIARNIHAHPTLSEVLMEAAHGAEGSPIHL